MMMSNERAAYRVLDPNGFFVDDTLYLVDENGDPAELYFDGIPNEMLEPLNELARQRMTAYLEMLDAKAKEAAEKLGRPFVGRPRNLDGALELATAVARDQMSIMGAKNRAPAAEKVSAEPIPEQGKRGRGRPRKNQHQPLAVVANG